MRPNITVENDLRVSLCQGMLFLKFGKKKQKNHLALFLSVKVHVAGLQASKCITPSIADQKK